VLIPRPNAADSGITTRCVLQKTCLACENDGDCGGDHKCVNIGGIGFLADFRCGAPCETDADCPDVDHTCQEGVDPANGKPQAAKACTPSFCEDAAVDDGE